MYSVAAEFQARTGIGSDRPDTPAPFGDKAFRLPVTSISGSTRRSINSGYGSGSASPIPEMPSSGNSGSNGNISFDYNNITQDSSSNAHDYAGRPKSARERAAFLLQQEKEMIQNMSANTLDQMRQAYVPVSSCSNVYANDNSAAVAAAAAAAAAGRGYDGQNGANMQKIEEHPMESSGESFASSGVHSDASDVDMSHLFEFLGRFQQKNATSGSEKDGDASVSSEQQQHVQHPEQQQPQHLRQQQPQHLRQQQQHVSYEGENAFQRLLKHIPIGESSLPPPPVFNPHTASSISSSGPPPPSVSQLTTMLRQRIMPPSPLMLQSTGSPATAASHSGFADGYAAAASALGTPFAAGGRVGASPSHAFQFPISSYSPNNGSLSRKSLSYNRNHSNTGNAFFGNLPHGHNHQNYLSHHHGVNNHHQHSYTPSPLHAPPSPFRFPPPGSPFVAGSGNHHRQSRGSCSSELVPYGGAIGSNGVHGATSGPPALEWPSSPNELFGTSPDDPFSIERAARLYRNAATICEGAICFESFFRKFKLLIY